MTRYVRQTAPRQYSDAWADDAFAEPAMLTVCDHDAVDTGLLFDDGTPILRAPNPIGFGREDEW